MADGGGVVVRRAQVHDRDDRELLAGLRWEWRLATGEEPNSSYEEFLDDFGAWLLVHHDTHHAHLALVDGEAVGMAWLAIVERIPSPGAWTRRSGFVQSAYVREAHRDQGIGGQVMDALIADARERGLAYLMVHPSERSMPFYARCGFGPYDRVLELRF